MITPQRLVVLRAVVAAGSIRAAAVNLNYSPATVSQHLQALARETGLVLFERHGRGILPTPAAHVLAETARGAIEELDRLDRTIVDLREGRAERLAIGCFSSAAQAWVPQMARALRELHPQLTLEISLNEPYDGGGRRTPDIDIRNESVNAPPLLLEGYHRHELAVEDFFAVLPRDHPLAAESAVALGELQHESWIDHDIYDSPTGQIIATACQAAGFMPRYSARLDDHHATLSLVAAGLGVTVLPRLALLDLPAALIARPLHHPAVQRRIVAHTRRNPRNHLVITAALTALREQTRPSE